MTLNLPSDQSGLQGDGPSWPAAVAPAEQDIEAANRSSKSAGVIFRETTSVDGVPQSEFHLLAIPLGSPGGAKSLLDVFEVVHSRFPICAGCKPTDQETIEVWIICSDTQIKQPVETHQLYVMPETPDVPWLIAEHYLSH
ncbi:hypothetical protein [Rhodoligotrophos ferricapiens]|uniref:hypothetical protein n=1 Tax=Rhodoligotrophos ferricapiens TaxID=3069264 RepID=UPI00315CD1E4